MKYGVPQGRIVEPDLCTTIPMTLSCLCQLLSTLLIIIFESAPYQVQCKILKRTPKYLLTESDIKAIQTNLEEDYKTFLNWIRYIIIHTIVHTI